MNRPSFEKMEALAWREAAGVLIKRHLGEFQTEFATALHRLSSGGYRAPIYRQALGGELFKVGVCSRKSGDPHVVAVHAPGCFHNHHDGQPSGERRWRVNLVPADQVVEHVKVLIGPGTRKRFKCRKCGGHPALHDLYPTER